MTKTSDHILENKKPNRLIKEKSPYLLEHAFNPVDWYPWGSEAKAKAMKEDKPIFVSIGYSSCHWCHVFRRESLEDVEVAKLLNDNFVSIKVDREERPDIDEIYMKAVQSITGSGGWPLNVFLTPNLEPFFGGTYFPPAPRYGMPSFSALLRNITQAWKSDRKNITDSAIRLLATLKESYETTPSSATIDESVLDNCYAELTETYDREYGGFGSAPKFPNPSNLFFLMRYHKRTGERAPLQIAAKTLDCMSSGGIYDQIGGGFHRYSTDRYWLVPHFEKMLYDDALLSLAYTEAFLITRNQNYRRIVDETLHWVLREMTSKETGGFYSAQDADSPEGEGSYYVWTPGSIREVFQRSDDAGDIGEKEADLVLKYFGVTAGGNFEDKASILTSQSGAQSVANELDTDESKVQNVLIKAKELLLKQRNLRAKPLTDDKILTGWNGMMISSMCKAYQAFNTEEYLSSAVRAADFILSTMSSQTVLESGKNQILLMRRFRDGEVKGEAVLEDYAYFGNSLIDLYESTFDSKYIRAAIAICNSMIDMFYDEKDGGGFFETRKNTSDIIARPKNAFDGAMPSSNSVAALFCLKMAEFTSDERFKNKAVGTFRAFWESIVSRPSAFTEMLVAIDFFLGSPKEIVISGDLENNETRVLIDAVRKKFLPKSVVLYADPELENTLPLIEARVSQPGQPPRVFVCTGFNCKLPSKTPQELEQALTT